MEQTNTDDRVFTQEEAREMAGMIDGAYEIIEVFRHRARESGAAYNVGWADRWLANARKYGATPDGFW